MAKNNDQNSIEKNILIEGEKIDLKEYEKEEGGGFYYKKKNKF